MSKTKLIDWNELSRRGLLVRINREILHPLGLAVCRDPETGKSPGAVVSDDGPFCYPEDPQVTAAEVAVIACPLDPATAEFQAEMSALRNALVTDGGRGCQFVPLQREDWD